MSYNLLRQAIIDRKQVVCVYQGLPREVCPHAIGTKRGERHVLVFQFGGQSSQGLPPDGQWRCMNPDEISGAIIQAGPWRTGSSHTRPQTCIDQIDVEVAY